VYQKPYVNVFLPLTDGLANYVKDKIHPFFAFSRLNFAHVINYFHNTKSIKNLIAVKSVL